MFADIAELVARHGYVMVVLFVAAEGLGIPLPGETALIVAAAIAAQGRLSLAGVVAAAALGTIFGGTGGYWIGRAGGGALLRGEGAWRRLGGQGLARGRAFFERYGAPSVFAARFVALLRTVVGMLAGASGMPFGRFSLYNALGGVVWAVVVGTGGSLVGRALPRLRGIGRVGFACALFLSLVVTLGLGARWLGRHRASLAARAARIPEAGYVTLHLAIAFLASVVVLFGFAAVTEDIVARHSLAGFDLAFALTLYARAPAALNGWAQALSLCAAPLILGLVGVGVAAGLLQRRRALAAASWVTALVGAVLLTLALELVIRRPRALVAVGLPFPGMRLTRGHGPAAVVVYGLLAADFAQRLRGRWARWALGALAGVGVAGIGAAEVYLGLSYFSDAIVGYAAGLVWLAGCVSVVVLGRGRDVPQADPAR